MRSEQEMFDLILETAREDERIRAVILNGSRANPNAPHDRFQDFDVVYVVTDVAPFKRSLEWIKRFGELMILQLPDDMQDPPPEEDNSGYGYLMQFADGNRIDLSIYPMAKLAQMERDSQSILLLDKDGIVQPFPPASDHDYLPKPPTAQAFADCCNEFWWVSPYVAKGLWRQEIIYAKHMLDHYVRDQLEKMLVWYIGIATGWKRNPGKFGKYYQQFLPPDRWEILLKTYSDADYEHTWQALFSACVLFRITALQVAADLSFDYPYGDDARVTAHLHHVHSLPQDAATIY